MELLTTREFNGVELQCYKDENSDDDFWATREQIGKLLGYEDPMRQVARLHNRNKERLDKFSTWVKLTTVEGNRTVTREVIVYSFKGLLEICRYSNQPNANAVIDKLWEIADDIRKNGIYMSDKAMEVFERDPKAFKHLLEKYTAEHSKNVELRKEIDDNRAFTILGKMVVALPGAMTLKDASNLLAQHGIHTGQNRMFARGRKDKFLCSRKGRQWNKPTQKAIDQGFFNVEISGGTNTITMITPKGLKHYSEILTKEEFPLLAELDKQAETEE